MLCKVICHIDAISIMLSKNIWGVKAIMVVKILCVYLQSTWILDGRVPTFVIQTSIITQTSIDVLPSKTRRCVNTVHL